MALDVRYYVMFAMVLWTVYSFIEVQTVALMSFIYDAYTALEVSTIITIASLICGSGFVR